MKRVLPCLFLFTLAVPLHAGEPTWPTPIKEFKPLQAGEHPRRFLRDQVGEMRKRAATPEGKVMVERLRLLLGGGDAMPSEYNPNRGKQPDGGGKFHDTAPVGKTYTLWHASGYGMLWQLTGEKKYADLGKQCVEKALQGQRDRDNRYSLRDPTGALRASPSLGAIAMAYDLCYDGWDDTFRKKVALEIQNYNEGQFLSLAELSQGKRLGPQSNHWGCQIGGAILALLAIKGDPGVDDKKITPLLAAAEKNVIRNLTEGFGDGGYFWEHAGPGQISSDTTFVPALQAMKIAGSLDFISPRPHASMVTMIRTYELLKKPGGGYHYMLRHPSTYGTHAFERVGLSRGGQVAQGFGAIKSEYVPALLWTYQNILEPEAGQWTYDILGHYPHRAVLALANGPLDIKEKNPADVLPRALHDSIRHYFVFRNQWKDENDIVITGLWGARKEKTGGPERIIVWALGEKVDWATCGRTQESKLVNVQADGYGVAKAGDNSLAVDFSKASGADALLVMIGTGVGAKLKGGGDKFRATTVKLGETLCAVLTISSTAKHPDVRVDQGRLIVGAQSIGLQAGTLVIGAK